MRWRTVLSKSVLKLLTLSILLVLLSSAPGDPNVAGGNGPQANGRLSQYRIGGGNLLLIFFMLWILGVPFSFLWLALMIFSYLGLV